MPKRKVKRRTRAPGVTREALLGAAFEEIYHHGFQAASLDAIVARTGVTKGALYHHFPSKDALGFAVVEEVVQGFLLQRWLGALDRYPDDPITAMQQGLRERADTATAEELRFGCPLNNLAQEMSPLDEAFRRRVNAAFDTWRDGFRRALERGQAAGAVRGDVDAGQIAAFVVAAAEGTWGLAKAARSLPVLRGNLDVLCAFLDTLRLRSP